MCGVFQERNTLVGEIEEDHRSTQNPCVTQHIHIDDVTDSH